MRIRWSATSFGKVELQVCIGMLLPLIVQVDRDQNAGFQTKLQCCTWLAINMVLHVLLQDVSATFICWCKLDLPSSAQQVGLLIGNVLGCFPFHGFQFVHEERWCSLYALLQDYKPVAASLQQVSCFMVYTWLLLASHAPTNPFMTALHYLVLIALNSSVLLTLTFYSLTGLPAILHQAFCGVVFRSAVGRYMFMV